MQKEGDRWRRIFPIYILRIPLILSAYPDFYHLPFTFCQFILLPIYPFNFYQFILLPIYPFPLHLKLIYAEHPYRLLLGLALSFVRCGVFSCSTPGELSSDFMCLDFGEGWKLCAFHHATICAELSLALTCMFYPLLCPTIESVLISLRDSLKGYVINLLRLSASRCGCSRPLQFLLLHSFHTHTPCKWSDLTNPTRTAELDSCLTKLACLAMFICDLVSHRWRGDLTH